MKVTNAANSAAGRRAAGRRSAMARAAIVGTAALGAAIAAPAMPALADINVCITVSATGPAASLGVPERNSVDFLPAEIGGQKVNTTVFDDATDAALATRNARKCVEEAKADIIIGSSTTPTSLATATVGMETGTPVIALAPINPPADVNAWNFRAPQHVSQMADALVAHMKANGVKTLGFIGYADAYGEDWLKVMTKQLEGSGIEMAPVERFARTDTSVTGQVLQLVSANPDAVLVVASGTPAAMPNLALKERGYGGAIYHTHGSASRDFIRVAGPAAEGTILPVGPVVVAAQLPDSHDSKALAMDYAKRYEAKYGEGSLSSFGGHMFDAGQLVAAAAPVALESGAQPGTPEFRKAMRDALEGLDEVVGVHGVFDMTPEDHFGHDSRSRVLVVVEDGNWKLLSGQ